MPEQFDPYYTWLGIPQSEQPADYYRLLGIQRFEDNREVISNAADQRMAHVRSFQTGPSARDSQRVLNELAKAAGCLLNPRRKTMYDQHLQSLSVTSRTEEAQHPPQTDLSPAVNIRATKNQAGTKSAARSHSSTRRRQQVGLAVIGTSLLAALVAVVVWISTNGGSTTPNVSNVSPANASVVSAVASVPEPKPDLTTEQPVGPGASRPVTTTASASSSGSNVNSPEHGTEKVTTKEATTKETPPSATPSPEKSTPTVPSPLATTPPSAVPDPTASSANPEPAQPEIPDGRPKALHFRGNDRVELANTRGLVDFGKPFTIEMWVRFASESSAHWIAGDLIIGPNHPDVPASTVAGWQLFIQQSQNGRQRLAFSTQEGYVNEIAIAVKAWHHIAACGDGRQLMVYVDGRRSITGDLGRLTGAFKPSPIPIHIGAHGYMHANQPSGFTGDLRAFRTSSVSRYSTNFEPAADWSKDADTLVLLDFRNSSGNRLSDVSGHGRDGTIAGARWIEVEIPPTSAVAATTNSPAPATSIPTPTSPSPAPIVQRVHPVPGDVELVQAREQMRKVLKDEFENSKDSKEQLALADKLMTLAAESPDDPAGRFAMLDEAHKLAAQAGDLSKSLSMIDDFAKGFAIDAPKLKVAAVTKCADAAKTTADRRRIAGAAVALLDDLIMAGRFDSAGDIAQVAVVAATRAKDVDLGKTAREYRDEIAQAKKRWNEAREAELKLADDEQNRELNLRWGRFLCFYQRNWSQGLTHLAIGSQESLAATAKLDLANPTLPEEQLAVGQAWSDALKSVEAAERTAVALRALYWLRQAESQLKGLAKANVEKQVKELESSLPSRFRIANNKPNKPAGNAAFQPPREFLGALGRIQVNGVDAGVMWKYDAGLRLTNQSIVDILGQLGVQRGKLRLEFAAFFYAHESMTVNIGHTGGSPTATASLIVDNKPLGEVGGMRATSDVYKVELNAGEHTIRWVLSGDDVGACALSFTNAATAQQLSLYHNPALLNLVRENPTRARLNVNMTRN